MSELSNNIKRAANYLDASGYKEFGHSVEVLRNLAASIEINEARAVVDADSFTTGELQRIPFSFSVTHGNGPTYTTKTVPILELTGQSVDTDGFETLDVVVINQDETKIKRISSDLLEKFHASTDENS